MFSRHVRRLFSVPVIALSLCLAAPVWAGGELESTQVDILLPSSPVTDFGASLDLDYPRLAVADPGGEPAAVHLYAREPSDADNWSEYARVTDPDEQAGTEFARSMAFEGATLVVGAPGYDSGTTTDAGIVYLFRADAGADGGWGLADTLTPETPVADARYGSHVALYEDSLAVSHGDGIDTYRRMEDGSWDFEQSISSQVSSPPVALGAKRLATIDGSDGETLRIFFLNADSTPAWRELRTREIDTPEPGSTTVDTLRVRRSTTLAGASDASSGNGAVFPFGWDDSDQSDWGQRQTLTSDSPGVDGRFGAGLDLHSTFHGPTTAAVGEPGRDAYSEDSGGVTVFHRLGRESGPWRRSGTLDFEQMRPHGRVGLAVALGQHVLFAGAAGRVHVFEINHAPVAPDLSVSTTQRLGMDIVMYEEVLDPDDDRWVLEMISEPEHGEAVTETGYTVHYNPSPTFVGTVSFDYRVDDGQGASSTGTIEVEISADNAAPVAQDDTVEVVSGQSREINPLLNDSDSDGDRLRFELTGSVPAGITKTNDGYIRIERMGAGSFSLGYRVYDPYGGSDTAQVWVQLDRSPDAGYPDGGWHGDDDVDESVSGPWICSSALGRTGAGGFAGWLAVVLVGVVVSRRRR